MVKKKKAVAKKKAKATNDVRSKLQALLDSGKPFVALVCEGEVEDDGSCDMHLLATTGSSVAVKEFIAEMCRSSGGQSS